MKVSKDKAGDWYATFEVEALSIGTHLLACDVSVEAGERGSLLVRIDSCSSDRSVLDSQLIALSIFWRDDIDLLDGVSVEQPENFRGDMKKSILQKIRPEGEK